MQAIVVRGLRKLYGNTRALDDISFEVQPGEVFGLLGPNGAGKTTAVEILEGFRRRDAGEVTVLGIDPERGGRRLRERIGLVLQECAVPPLLTVTELIDLYRGYYPAPRPTADIIELVGLGEKSTARVKTLSGGQQRRLDVALSLVGDPELIFLDEPTTGFDPSARRQAWELVRSMRALGKTILLTTHYMEEAEQLADRICILRQGLVVAEGTPQSLRAATDGRTRVRFTLPDRTDVSALAPAVTMRDGLASLETTTPAKTLHDLTAWALERNLELADLEVTRPSLEDVYLELTAHE